MSQGPEQTPLRGQDGESPPGPEREPAGILTKAGRLIFGPPRDFHDRSIFHKISLVALLAWIGLGADGLSSSSYGPDEVFRTLGDHAYLSLGIAALMATTIFVIAAAYSRIIEEFPHGGGGYVVATKLLGPRTGVVSGAALLVDYVMTITVSIASSGDALFSFAPLSWHPYKVPVEAFMILALTVINIRGVKESVLVLAPVFFVFVITHIVGIVAGIIYVPDAAGAVSQIQGEYQRGLGMIGGAGMFFLFIHAYSMGGGTYTGIEAVSNGLPIMREPRVRTARRTMLYMAVSLAFTASGLLVCYLLWRIAPAEGKTMNAVLFETMTRGLPFNSTIVVITLVSEGALLVVAAQAGFIDGPRVLANMAMDYWAPRRFASLSDRLTTQNGIVLMGAASLAALLHAKGDVRLLVVMYSINVFLTFSLSMFGMAKMLVTQRHLRASWKRKFTLFSAGFALCATILVITTIEKFPEGGWLTAVVTSAVVVSAFVIRRHYRTVAGKLSKLDALLLAAPRDPDPSPTGPDPDKPTAAVLVAGFGGLGVHTVLNIHRMFPHHYGNIVFLSVGEVGSGAFKGERSIHELTVRAEESLVKYRSLAKGMGLCAQSRLVLGTDVIEEAERLCLQVTQEFPKVTFFAGKIIFERERWWHRVLHNDMALRLQKRLQWDGHTMVIVPAKVQ